MADNSALFGVPDYARLVGTIAAGNSGIIIGGTSIAPTISLNPASLLLPEVVAGTNVTSVVKTFGLDGHAIFTVNAAGGGGGGGVASVTSGNSAIVIGGTAANPTVAIAPASPLLPEVVAGTNITSVVQTFDGIDGHAIYTVNAAGGGGGAVNSVTSGNSAIVIGGTAADPTVAIAPASPLLPEVVAGTNITSVIQTFDGIDGHAIYTVNAAGGGGGAVNSVTSGNSAIVIGGTASDPTVAIAPASPLLPEVVAGTNITSVVQTFDGIDGHAIYTVNAAAGGGTVASVTSGNSAIVIGGTAANPTVGIVPASPLLPEVVAGTNITSVVQTFDGIDGHAIYTVNAAAGGGTVTSVTAGDASIVVGGTATDPTVAVAPNFVTTAALSGLLVTGGPIGPYTIALDPLNVPLAFWEQGTSVVAGKELSSWTPINAAADADIALIPKGVGGISMRNYATSTTVGGFSLGAGSIDLQNTSAVGNVGYITGANSAVLGGLQGIVTGDRSVIIGGGSSAVAAGHTLAGSQAAIIAGQAGTINVGSLNAVLLGGNNNSITSAGNGIIAGGTGNTITSTSSAIIGGTDNIANGIGATVIGGFQCQVLSGRSSAVGGTTNIIGAVASNSVITGGITNSTTGTSNVIGGGSSNIIAGASGFIAAGTGNNILVAVTNGFIGGGTGQNAAGTNGTTNIASVGGSHTTNSASNSIMTGSYGTSTSTSTLEDANKFQMAGGSALNPELITVIGRNKNGQGAIVTSALHSSQHSTCSYYMEWDDQTLVSASLTRNAPIDLKSKKSMLGYMVSLDKEGHICKANSLTSVVGVTVSGDDGVVGGGHDLCYKNKYQRDEFGTIMTRPSHIESFVDLLATERFGSIILKQDQVAHLQFASPKEILTQFGYQLDAKQIMEVLSIEFEPRQVALLDPKFDPAQKYIARSGRVGWSAVAHTGSAVVRDDGKCIIGQRCVPKNGIATPSAEEGYHVVSRVSANTITILL